MSLADDLARTLPDFRRLAESRMTSRCTVWRPTLDVNGKRVQTVDADGFETPAWAAIYTDLPLRLIRGEGYRTLRVGDVDTQVANRLADLPVSTVLADDDLLEITAGDNAGRVVRVLESMGADQRKSLRVPVVEERRPEEWA